MFRLPAGYWAPICFSGGKWWNFEVGSRFQRATGADDIKAEMLGLEMNFAGAMLAVAFEQRFGGNGSRAHGV